MAQLTLDPQILAHLEGEFQGQIVVGNHNVQVNLTHGDLIVKPERQVSVRLRPAPVDMRPRPYPALLDRKSEMQQAITAWEGRECIEFWGRAGIGKSVLLRHLAHLPATEQFPAGVVYLSVREKPLADVLQCLFDALYESDLPYKLSEAESATRLRELDLLILLDDVELEQEKVEALMNCVRSATVLFFSRERRLWEAEASWGLRGLPVEDALVLIEQVLGQQLTGGERANALAFCQKVGGHPLELRQVSARARDEGCSITEIIRRIGGQEGEEQARPLALYLVERQGAAERRLLTVLAALQGASLPVEHLAALAGVRDVEPVIEAMQERGLVRTNSPRYTLAPNLAQLVEPPDEFILQSVLPYFADWAEEHWQEPATLLEEAEPILNLMRWAAAGERWAEALQLARAIEGALTLGGQWEARREVLELALRSARALGDRGAEAWAMHQLGTRAIGLGKLDSAHEWLTRALKLRVELGDWVGAAITNNNLEFLSGGPPGPFPEDEPSPNGGWLNRFLLGLKSFLVVLLVGMVIWSLAGWPSWSFLLGDSEVEVTGSPALPSLTPTVEIVAATDTPSPTPTSAPDPTSTDTPSATPTVTATSTATLSPTFTASPTATDTPSPTATDTPSPTATDTPSPTATDTPSPTPTDTPTNTPTPTPTYTPTPTAEVVGQGCEDPREYLVWQGDSGYRVQVSNRATSCSFDIGMASYQKFDENRANERLYHSVQETLRPGASLVLAVRLPECAAHVTLFYGPLLISLAEEQYGSRLLEEWHLGGEDYCPWPDSEPCPGEIVGLAGIEEGMTVDGRLTVEALIEGDYPAYVLFELVGPHSFDHLDDQAPFFFMGDRDGVPHGWDSAQYPEGDYRLRATYYGRISDGRPVSCNSVLVGFSVRRAEPTFTEPTPTQESID